MLSLTRLRLIASREVVAAAEQLHIADVAVMAAAFEGPVPPDAHWDTARQSQQDRRRRFIRETRRSLGLRSGADIQLAGPWRHSARPGQAALVSARTNPIGIEQRGMNSPNRLSSNQTRRHVRAVVPPGATPLIRRRN